MLGRFAYNMTVDLGLGLGLGLGLCASGCIPCGFDETQTLQTPEEVTGSLLSNGMQKVVGSLGTVTQSRALSFGVNRSEIQEAPGKLTYSLEVYNGGSACPPDPASKLSVVGTATDASTSTIAEFGFSWPNSLQSLDGKVLVLRAAAQSQESTVSVVCTAPLVYSPAKSMIHCSGM